MQTHTSQSKKDEEPKDLSRAWDRCPECKSHLSARLNDYAIKYTGHNTIAIRYKCISCGTAWSKFYINGFLSEVNVNKEK